MTMRLRILLLGAGLLFSSASGCSLPSGFDPVVADPAPFDEAHPPVIAERVFEVAGARLNAIVYVAQGVGPHPTVVLLHGFPGNEKNLDLAQAIRRAGWNVVFFHYRGSWGSGGRFGFEHVLEDVAGVVETISAADFAASHRIDPTRLALVGHSMGGFAALVSGAELSAIDCVVSMAGANLGGLAKGMAESPAQIEGMARTLDGWAGPLGGASGSELIAEIETNLERFDTLNHVETLGRKDLLLIAGGRDQVTPITLHHDPLVEALNAGGASSLDVAVFDQADHAFSGQRISLARRVTRWLASDCEIPD